MADKNIKILIADDSAFMRKVLQNILTGAGYSQFVECENGEDCLRKFNDEKPDLVLLDIVMPGISGLEILKKIGLNTDVIIISALGQDNIVEDAKKYGAKGYIVKPFERDVVLEEIEKLFV